MNAVGFFIQLDTDNGQFFANHGTNPVRMLTDACGEHQIIQSAQIQKEGTDIVDNAGDEYIHSQLCTGISLICCFHYIA